MIRPLRQRHRCIVTTLAVALPLVFIAAILARRPFPISGVPVSDPASSLTITNRAGPETGAPR
jgi:hypothetical protein